MNERDYADAWNLISGWRDDDARDALLRAHLASERRPYVVIAMIQIAGTLAHASRVAEGLVDQLSGTAYASIEKGILNITDQILVALDKDDNPDNIGAEESMEQIPVAFAKREAAAAKSSKY